MVQSISDSPQIRWKKTKRSTINELTITLRNKCEDWLCQPKERHNYNCSSRTFFKLFNRNISMHFKIFWLIKEALWAVTISKLRLSFRVWNDNKWTAIFISNYYYGINPEPITKIRAWSIASKPVYWYWKNVLRYDMFWPHTTIHQNNSIIAQT